MLVVLQVKRKSDPWLLLLLLLLLLIIKEGVIRATIFADIGCLNPIAERKEEEGRGSSRNFARSSLLLSPLTCSPSGSRLSQSH